MTVSSASPSTRLAAFVRRPLFIRSFAGLLAAILLYGAFGYVVLPRIIQSQVEKIIPEKLHRTASISKVEVRPFALALTIHDFSMREPQSDAVFASFETLTVNLSAESLWRLAPVVQSARLDKPYVHLVRTDAHHYNIDDLLKKDEKSAAEEQKPARFSLNNLEIAGGRIDFEDQPAGARHAVESLDIGVPFISSLPSQVDIVVEPLLSAKVNGTPLLFKGKAKPFAADREAVLELKLDGLDLTRFVEYLPFKPAFKLASARLDTRLAASFRQPHGQVPSLTLSGDVQLKSLQMTDPKSGKTFLALPELRVTLDRTSILSKQIDVAKVAIKGMEVEASRLEDGRIDLQRLFALAPAATPATQDSPAAMEGKPKSAPAVNAAASTPAPAKPQDAATIFRLGEFDILDLAMRYTDRRPAGPLSAGVEKFNATLRKLAVDTGARKVEIGEVVSKSAHIQVRHDKRQASASAPAAIPAVANANTAVVPAAVKVDAKAGLSSDANTPAGYTMSVGRIGIENWEALLEDRSQAQPASSKLGSISLNMTDLSTAPSARSRIALKATANRNGQLALDGTLGIFPLHADLTLDMHEVDLLPVQPYVTDRINLQLSRAGLSGKGKLQLDQQKNGELAGGFKGEVTLANVATVDKQSGSDFLRWKSLYFGGVDVNLQPLALTVEQVALSDFFARIIIDPSGRINLQDIVRSHAEDRRSLTEANARSAGPQAGQTAASAASPDAGTAKAKAASSAVPEMSGAKAGNATTRAQPVTPVKIGKLTLQGGRVRFTDNFIKPNYTANLMGLGGVVTGLSSNPESRATVNLRGQVNSAPLTVAGNINPLKGDLTMDLQAKVRDMELAPLSPYSGRYVGYGIEKGKLSFDVAYRIDKRKLTANNRLILDQLTFGDKIDNAGAASLPVHLAVALLRDRNGVIDLNLPIEGSLDEPQFSIGAIIVKVIVNTITKAVTAPFTLLGSLFGGGEELSYLEFTPGRATIAAEGDDKLKALAKALTERPALKLEITAHTGTEAEIEGMKRAAILRKVRALKQKNLADRGQPVPEGGVEVKPEEYPALLAKVYKGEKFPKPRNMIGLQKDLPAAEMEKLMMANTPIDEDDLTALGNRRAQAVKDWLLKNGQVPGERVFILATKTATQEAKSAKEPGPSRVDFSLR
ncbi:uncharacterized protein involved in outer membrane biogenesis [Paucimonas lemoignei]|uniref:Uncharacterized protein involved in outer membrane biogenesis n=1 Tax=Paucimonas lemoignei TaxID=29443 RepID=A0A4R3HYR1_PAULE|nr:DUF748 domain-containing protein [Paucimonas lemoignei]TCS37365.1 uncharacterized protein involved in outer membrane biogenesis [Paucimonas lemoignei]